MSDEIKKSALRIAEEQVSIENPDLPMKLKFEVSAPDVIAKLLAVNDLTVESQPGQPRNIIGKIFDDIIAKLTENGFPNITVVRGNPVVLAEDNFDKLLFSPGNPGRSSTYTRYTDENHILRTHTSI